VISGRKKMAVIRLLFLLVVGSSANAVTAAALVTSAWIIVMGDSPTKND